ncbi:MAG: hypothetical protein GY748_26080, partial [Planctomycetaceae bacterium]|nr:hypothetical protein [Planctomycetaceae bacterium]
MITRKIALNELIKVLHEVQADIDDEPEHINENTQPFEELEDFGSLVSVSVTQRCLAALGFKGKPPFASLFIHKGKALTVGKAADRI